MLGGAGDDFGTLDAERIEVFKKSFFEAGGVLADGLVERGGVADDLVVNVGDVHDVADGDAEQLERTAQDIDLEEGAEVADVAVIVDGGAAGVDAKRLARFRGEGFDRAGQCVV